MIASAWFQRGLLLLFFAMLTASCYWSWNSIRTAVNAELASDADANVLALDWSSVALLRTVARDNATPVVVFYSSLYIVKQTLSLPGSAVLNLIAGALFGAVQSFVMISVLTTGEDDRFDLLLLCVSRNRMLARKSARAVVSCCRT
jgi:hypothetical protein